MSEKVGNAAKPSHTTTQTEKLETRKREIIIRNEHFINLYPLESCEACLQKHRELMKSEDISFGVDEFYQNAIRNMFEKHYRCGLENSERSHHGTAN